VNGVEIVELAAITPQMWTELAAGEQEPWGRIAEALSWREKDRLIGLRGPDGQLLAVAGSLIAEVEVDGAGAFAVLGIGSVFVTPSARGRGLVARMLEVLLSPPQQGHAADRAMLFCREPLMALYRKSGFAEVRALVSAEQPDGPIEMSMRAMWRALGDGVSWPPGSVAVRGLPF
jgi:predicted GNAT family N-acyltransferase